MKTSLPKYNVKLGWRGGDPRTLYKVTDKRTGGTKVLPGHQLTGIGPAVLVDVARIREAEAMWQCPLSPGWTVRV